MSLHPPIDRIHWHWIYLRAFYEGIFKISFSLLYWTKYKSFYFFRFCNKFSNHLRHNGSILWCLLNKFINDVWVSLKNFLQLLLKIFLLNPNIKKANSLIQSFAWTWDIATWLNSLIFFLIDRGTQFLDKTIEWNLWCLTEDALNNYSNTVILCLRNSSSYNLWHVLYL